MREIKFRAWDKIKKKMLYPDKFAGYPDLITMDGGYMYRQGKRVLGYTMQYIGLKDKNGKEIYEGDICRFVSAYSFDAEDMFIKIEYCEDRCSLMPREIEINSKGGRYWVMWDECREIEIIGNIYETPDILPHPTKSAVVVEENEGKSGG